MTIFERTVSLAVAVIGCAAAVVMVPDVRCGLGLDDPVECMPQFAAKPRLPTTAGTPTRLAPVQDPRVTRIRKRFEWIEANQYAFLSQDVPLGWKGADSATATIYVSGGEIPKIRARVYTGTERSSLLFYYASGQLIFVHQVNATLPSGPRYEQRFWFDGGLFRWRGPGNGLIDGGAPEFAQNSSYLTQLGTHLMELAVQTVQAGG